MLYRIFFYKLAVNVTFSPGNHFDEAQTTEQIGVRINTPIIRDLQVNIRSSEYNQ